MRIYLGVILILMGCGGYTDSTYDCPDRRRNGFTAGDSLVIEGYAIYPGSRVELHCTPYGRLAQFVTRDAVTIEGTDFTPHSLVIFDEEGHLVYVPPPPPTRIARSPEPIVEDDPYRIDHVEDASPYRITETYDDFFARWTYQVDLVETGDMLRMPPEVKLVLIGTYDHTNGGHLAAFVMIDSQLDIPVVCNDTIIWRIGETFVETPIDTSEYVLINQLEPSRDPTISIYTQRFLDEMDRHNEAIERIENNGASSNDDIHLVTMGFAIDELVESLKSPYEVRLRIPICDGGDTVDIRFDEAQHDTIRSLIARTFPQPSAPANQSTNAP